MCAFLFAASAAIAPAAGAEILIGQSAGFSGGQADYSRDVRNGILACFEAVNLAGGINGSRLKLVGEDDKGSRDQVLANTRKLIEKDKVFALIGYTSGAGVEASLPVIEAARVPMLSPATGNAAIRAEFRRYLFHSRAGYADEMRRIADTLAVIGVRRVALVYMQDTTANRKVMEEALAANNLSAAAAIGVDRNAREFVNVVDSLMETDAQAVLFITNAKPLVEMVRGMKQRGYTGEFVTSSFAGVGFVNELKADAVGVKLIQVLPPPTRSSIRVAREFRGHLAQLDPKAPVNYTSFEGYIAARVLVEGLRRAGRTPTRERLVGALESMKSVDLGDYEVSYSPTNHGGSRFVDIGVVNTRNALVF